MKDAVPMLPEDRWSAALTPAQRQAIRAVLDDLQARDDLLGVVLAGSLVRGEGGPTSDLDVYAVVSSPWRQRRQLLIDGVRVELFINPPWVIRSYLSEEARDGAPLTAHMLATGTVLHARGSTLVELRGEAADLLAAGPRELTEAELTARRYFLIDLSEDADDVRDDPDALSYVLPLVVERAISLLYARARRWRPKPKRLPADLERFDREAGALLRAYLRESDLACRYGYAMALVERAITPLPRTFFAWDSPLEQMPP